MINLKDDLFQCLSKLLAGHTDPIQKEKEIWQHFGDKVAVMVLDSSGFSRTTDSHGIVHFLSLIVALRELCDPILKSHNSEHIYFAADNIFAVFRNADDAVNCARAIHREIDASKLALTETERFRVSIGIGFGELLYSRTVEGYFGEEMNYASKLGEDIGAGDQTLLTASAFTHIDPKLQEGFSAKSIEISGINLQYHQAHYTPDQ